jgi:predicted amidohydrolase YtcJ
LDRIRASELVHVDSEETKTVPETNADAVIITGDIVTMNPARPRVGAVAVAGGRVVATGSPGEAGAALPAGTPRLELPGTVLPGLIDSHVHMLWGGRELEEVDVSGCRSVTEIQATIRAYGAAHPRPAWICGSAGIDREDLAEGRFPTAAELEEAGGGRPVLLWRRSHDAFASTTALALAGIDADTPDPPGGVIERDASGRASGFLIERPAAELVAAAVPAATLDDRRRWLAQIQPRFLAAGITSIVDPALSADELNAYARAAASGELTVRVTGMPLGDGEIDPAALAARFAAAGVELDNRDGERWRIGPWKLFLDGGGSLGTALLHQPWPGTEDYHGNQTTSTAGLRAYARWAAETGAGLGVHAVGGAAIDLVLDAFSAAAELRPLAGLGFTLIHAYLWPSAAQMRRCAELDILVATQSPLQWAFGPGLIRRFGTEAVGRAHPLRSWLASGATVGGGSDGPGGPPIAPLWAMWQLRTRAVDGHAEPVGIDEAVDAEQALGLYTTGAAAVALAPDRGRLAPGCAADLVAVDVDPLSASPEAVRDAGVLVTLVDGAIVHDSR